ncbi:MAG: hypothetical protein LBU23_09390 [Planctomycetota bacterium]|jgi:hypothetical protein|nr:hypothetical protein [Planctomycetota bacterium]
MIEGFTVKYIEGDNLEVLKLQKSYAGKVKMIYIDRSPRLSARAPPTMKRLWGSTLPSLSGNTFAGRA